MIDIESSSYAPLAPKMTRSIRIDSKIDSTFLII
jgi:hypothetical protein